MAKRTRLTALMAATAAGVIAGWGSLGTVQAATGTRTVSNGIAIETPVAPQVAVPPETAIFAEHLAKECHVSVGGMCIQASPNQSSGSDCVESPSDYNCTGYNPEANGCSGDASTVADAYYKNNHTDQFGYTELRWSGKCQSNWARYTASLPECCTNRTIPILSFAGYGSGDDSRTEGYYTSGSNAEDSVYGEMLWGGNTAPNCVAADGWAENSDGSHFLQETSGCV